jgi:DNA ligase (NAD+)
MTREDKLKLYNEAKEAYYNGVEIMSDQEFDKLEKELGLENNSYVGTHHQKSYTIEHPFLMGSLSKVQIVKNNRGVVDYDKFAENVNSYLKKSLKYGDSLWYCDVTPKFDGCSFEAVIDWKGNLLSVSTRGDGEFGKDIKDWFAYEWSNWLVSGKVRDYMDNLDDDQMMFLEKLVIRGECLINKNTFDSKYSKDFTIPRSFVSGIINSDWEDTPEQHERRKDLSWVCYDYREIYENGVIIELDYMDEGENLPGEKPSHSYRNIKHIDGDKLKEIYSYFEKTRNECDYALDGFVIKPVEYFRLQDNTRERQEDCIAVKFLPEIVKANIVDVEWNVGKTGEYFPTAILEEVILGGKKVNRVSLHNYDWMVKNMCGVGSQVDIVLSGDIIPNVLEVYGGSSEFLIPDDATIEGNSELGENMHLMKEMSKLEKNRLKFMNSVNTLKIDGIGEKVGESLYNIIPEDNIIKLMIDSNLQKIKSTLGDCKSTMNIINALKERRNKLTLYDVVLSLCLPNCGEKNTEWFVKKISGLNPDIKGVPVVVKEMSENEDIIVMIESEYIKPFGISYVSTVINIEERTPIIMTGSPKACGFNTKSDFLSKHPEYVETSKWNECKILFTDDLESDSSKMQKAKKLGITIRKYS